MSNRILDMIGSPADLKCLNEEELTILSRELREEIVSVTSETGGHVASSLGTVEIIVALHSMMNCPSDKIVFDVGHQAYAHKLLTGRLQEFGSLRTYGGISGFTKPNESPFDVHPSGHASDSLSVAHGLAKARDLTGGKERIVAVIGDASLSGGMAFEALNHIGHEQTPMVIILNDNEMSISRNVGALMKHLGYMRASTQYRQTRDSLQEILERRGRLGQNLVSIGKNMKESLKQFVIPRSMIFESLGILCTAPIDGHDIGLLKETLANVLDTDVPVLMHVVTRKGAGYAPAENEPEKFHGVGSYDAASGKIKKQSSEVLTFTQAFSKALLAEAERDERVVAITAAMKDGTGLHDFAERYPERFLDVGIAEGHAVGMASGLAIGGQKPVIAMYSTFMQRAIDQMIIDNALPNLDVVFSLDRGGLVGDDGPTHHGVFDFVYSRMVPHMKVIAPSDEVELTHALHTALALGGPFTIRYPRGNARGSEIPSQPQVLEPGKSTIVREGEEVAILAWGRMVHAALDAAKLLDEQGIDARVVDMRWAKPFDRDAIKQAAQTKLLVTVEEGVICGGVGEGVLDEAAAMGCTGSSLVLGIDDKFVGQGKVELLFRDLQLDGEGIAARIIEKLSTS